MYAGAAAGAGCYGVAMAPGGAMMMPNAQGMMQAAYGMPAMYNLQPVCLSQVIFSRNYRKTLHISCTFFFVILAASCRPCKCKVAPDVLVK